MKKTVRAVLIAVMVLLMSGIGMSACFAGSSVSVNVTLSEDSDFLTGRNGTVMMQVPVTVEYFDLADYGLEAYRRLDEDDEVIEQPTLLHVFIKVIEQYYAGHTLTPDEVHSNYINITGAYKSIWLDRFWGHDGNLMYFVNHSYPLMTDRWGATADYIIPSNGDVVDLAMFTDWNFYTNSAFLYFTRDEVRASAGSPVTLTLMAALTEVVNYGIDPGRVCMEGETLRVSSDGGRTWTPVPEKTKADGTVSVTFDEPGTYYVASGPQHANYKDAAPAVCTVSVTEPTPDEEAAARATAVAAANVLIEEVRPYLDKEAEYTEATFGAFRTACDSLTAMIGDPASRSADIVRGTSALREAYDALKTKAEELAEAKAAAKAELSEYKAASDYRAAEQELLKAAVADGISAIEAASTPEDVASCLAEAKAVIDKLKTAAELDEEERAAAEAEKLSRAVSVELSESLISETAQYVGKDAVYTVKSYGAFISAREKLEALIKDEKSLSSEIDEARASLRAASILLKNKDAQPMKVSAAGQKTFRASMLRKSAKTFRAVTVSCAKGSVTYKVSGTAASKKALSFNRKTGKVTVKKGTGKGSYKLKIKVSAAGNGGYLAGSRTVTVKVRIK